MRENPRAPGRATGPPRGGGPTTGTLGWGWTLSLVVLTGCYSYQSVPELAPAPGATVAVELTAEGTAGMAEVIGPNAAVVRGDMITAEADSLELAVRAVEDHRGVTTPWRREVVRIPRTAVARVGQRRLGVFRSLLLGGAVTGGLVGAWVAIQGEVIGAMGGPGNGTGVPK